MGRRGGRSARPDDRSTAGSVQVPVRVKPGAGRARIGGCFTGPYGPAVVIAVSAPPVDGRATEAARRALAEALGVRASSVHLRAGAASRDKLFQLDDPPADVTDRVARLRDGQSSGRS